MLTKIIYKNFRSNLKNYILFFLSNIVAIMELFVFYGIRSIIKNSITDKVTAEALKTDFQIAVGIIAVITLMLMFYAMKCYIKLRIKDYSMFLILGMKKKAVSLLLLFEYCIGCVISLILGIGTGRILLYIIQRLLVKYYPQYIRMYVLRYQIYKNVCLGSISIMILVFVVLLIWLDGRSLGMLMAEDKKNEKRPISYMWIILAVIGIVLMMAGIILYCGSDTQYLYAHGVLLMGLILAVVFGLALFLNLLKKCKNFYYRYMLDLNQLYSRYLNHMILLILLIVVHFFSLSYLVVQTAELLPLDQYRNQYPYDMIWITEKGNKEYAKKLASTYNGTLTEVPMMRVSTYYGANHIGISEKTYRKLSKSPALNLKENQIAVRIENSDEKQEDIKDSAYWEGYSTLYAGKYFGKQDSDTLIDVKKNKDIHFNIQSICTQTVWILIDAMLDTWEAEHQILISQLEEQEKHALQTKVKILEERYQEMLKSRKVVHDMKNHILALKNYDQEQNWPGLHEYLNELSDDMLEYNFHVWTGNHMLDMILNQKEKDAQNQNTVMQIDTEVFSTLPFTDREIISLFGNLLDNALEACEKINDKKRWIKIKIKKKNLLLYIEIANALEEMPKQIQKEFVSNKKDNGLHGYGMKNIQDIIKKYDGIFEYKVYEDHLIFMISIYNN
ncbi:GHKL domain-containing protein [Dorea longicatena]|uniref:GHKL domain-containing protein n=2 Tax=Dorea longicatena TaxID=88431 RepID=UPI0020A095CF|nr:GHKL domain-containing protein [Dorea longicatena]UTB46572.1 GHKL domain-containing protein [Dorea longicatena]